MSWWQLVPTLLLTAGIVFLPGYLILRCWAFTGLVAVGAAAPVSISLIAVAAVAAPLVGMSFTVLVVVIPAVVVAAVGLVLRRTTPKALGMHGRVHRPTRSRWTLLAHFGALLIPAVLLGRGLVRMIGDPENIAQRWDNVFHLNVVRFIVDTGSGSSLTAGGMYSGGAKPSAYPAAWHDLVALVVQLSDVTIPVAVNAVTIVVGALVWPISAIFLATRVTGPRPVPVLFAGALSAAFGSFPYLIVEWGVLYPYFLSLALLPAALALVAMATGVGDRGGAPRWLAAVALVVVTPGIALSHPSTSLALLLFAVPIFVVAIVRYRRILGGRAGQARYWLRIGLLGVYLAAGIAIWLRVRPSAEGSHWGTIQRTPQAIGQVLSGAFMDQGVSWVVLALTLVAIGLVMRRQFSQWVLGVYLIAAVLFVVVSSARNQELRNLLTGVWYNDSFRLAALLPTITVVVCTIAATWLFFRTRTFVVERFPGLAELRFTRDSTPAAALVAFVAAAFMGYAGQYSSVNYQVAAGKNSYRPSANAPLLSPAERALLTRLDQHVPEDATIIGNPWTGTAFAYAFGDRRTLTPHIGVTIPKDIKTLMDDLDQVGRDPEICALVDKYNSYYVLDFAGRNYLNWPEHFPGLAVARSNPHLEIVDREGYDAILYRIAACGAASAPGR